MNMLLAILLLLVSMANRAPVATPRFETPSFYTVSWTPGDYTNFVAVSSIDLTIPVSAWTTYLVTNETNFQFTAEESQRFFAIYGTNPPDGQSAWAGSL